MHGAAPLVFFFHGIDYNNSVKTVETKGGRGQESGHQRTMRVQSEIHEWVGSFKRVGACFLFMEKHELQRQPL